MRMAVAVERLHAQGILLTPAAPCPPPAAERVTRMVAFGDLAAAPGPGGGARPAGGAAWATGTGKPV
jgi:hypothetical protein